MGRAGKLPEECRHGDFERGFLIGGLDFMEAHEAKRVFSLSSSDDLIWFNGALAVERSRWPRVFLEIYKAGWKWSAFFPPYKGSRGFNGGRHGPPIQSLGLRADQKCLAIRCAGQLTWLTRLLSCEPQPHLQPGNLSGLEQAPPHSVPPARHMAQTMCMKEPLRQFIGRVNRR